MAESVLDMVVLSDSVEKLSVSVSMVAVEQVVKMVYNLRVVPEL